MRQAQLLVEVHPTDVYPAISQDVVPPIGLGGAARPQADQGKVRRTPTDVDDQHQLFAINLRFIVEGGCQGFKLKFDVGEPHAAGDFAQRVLRGLVGRRVVVDEEHRPAQHRPREIAAGGRFGAPLQFGDKAGQEHAKRNRTPLDFRGPIDQRTAQQALHRPHQAPVITRQVVGNRGAAIADLRVFIVEKNGRRQGGLAVFQGEKRALVGAAPAYGGVGRAEVDAACGGDHGEFWG
ncbi:hypothetical protein D3C72_1334490 [compost metagenome]